MNEKTIASAEKALKDFIKKNKKEHDYYKGRLIRADKLAHPDQHMVSAAIAKVNWYKTQVNELEGQLDLLREELGIIKEISDEESTGEE
ncbi:hypothetical protein FJZ33_05875 [Candidatus Poribacteria bacterium]|nr:hypothetical protein [Candidatus Poribacteria bacterium]